MTTDEPILCRRCGQPEDPIDWRARALAAEEKHAKTKRNLLALVEAVGCVGVGQTMHIDEIVDEVANLRRSVGCGRCGCGCRP